MWRKQDESKAPATSPQAAPPQPQQAAPPPPPPPAAVPAPLTAPVSVSPPSSARPAAAPAGHITKGLVLKGEISGKEDLLVEGEVHGQIRIAEGRVTIAPGGRVVAWVEARDIMVRGQVKGDLRATEQVQIGATGSVIGDIVTPRISIDEGAELRGNVDTTRAEARFAARAGSSAAVPANVAKSEGRPAVPPSPTQTKEAVPRA